VAENVYWGGMIVKKIVDPKRIDAAFNDSKLFVAEIFKKYPESYKTIT